MKTSNIKNEVLQECSKSDNESHQHPHSSLQYFCSSKSSWLTSSHLDWWTPDRLPDHILIKPFLWLKESFLTIFIFSTFFPTARWQTICLDIGLAIQKKFLAIQPLYIYLYSFLLTEQLKCTSIVFREGGYMKIKSRWPSFSLLRKDFF